jgi:hypothetical protein
MTNSSASTSDFFIRELEYRREKQWKIFSWASTIFTAIIGGIVVLKTREHPHQFNIGLQSTLISVVVVLLVSAGGWIGYNRRVENNVVSQLEKSGIVHQFPRAWIGYRLSLTLLALGAIAAILIPV